METTEPVVPAVRFEGLPLESVGTAHCWSLPQVDMRGTAGLSVFHTAFIFQPGRLPVGVSPGK